MLLKLLFRWFSPPVDIFVPLGGKTMHHNPPAITYPHVGWNFLLFFIVLFQRVRTIRESNRPLIPMMIPGLEAVDKLLLSLGKFVGRWLQPAALLASPGRLQTPPYPSGQRRRDLPRRVAPGTSRKPLNKRGAFSTICVLFWLCPIGTAALP
jgi:hypothetical protein